MYTLKYILSNVDVQTKSALIGNI